MSSAPVPPDEDLARLRAADPAAGSTVDLTALRAAVDARRTEAAADGVTDGPSGANPAPGTPSGIDELARARARRLQWPARVAVAAAAALVVGGGGGFALGASGAGSEQLAVSDAGGAEESWSGAADGGAVPEGMVPQEDMAPESMAEGPRLGGAGDAALWAPGGRTVFTGAASLSTAAGSATAWALDATASFSEERVTQVADALGLDAVRLEDGVWRAGAEPGAGPVLDVQPDGLTSASFYDPAADPWACGVDDLTEDGACTERDLGPAPEPGAAEADTVELLTALGVPTSDLSVTSEAPDATWVHVTAEPQVDGRPTGLPWSATWTGGGLQSLYGPLASLTELGEYAVVSPAQAVERLGDPRFGDGGMAMPFAARGEVDAVAPTVEPGAAGGLVLPERPTGEPPTPLSPGAAVPWPVMTVELVTARLVLAVHHGAGGAAALLPTYELADATGATWRVLALDEQHLDLAGGR